MPLRLRNSHPQHLLPVFHQKQTVPVPGLTLSEFLSQMYLLFLLSMSLYLYLEPVVNRTGSVPDTEVPRWKASNLLQSQHLMKGFQIPYRYFYFLLPEL